MLYKIATAGRYEKSPNSRYISSRMNTTQLLLAVCRTYHSRCRITHRSLRLFPPSCVPACDQHLHDA